MFSKNQKIIEKSKKLKKEADNFLNKYDILWPLKKFEYKVVGSYALDLMYDFKDIDIKVLSLDPQKDAKFFWLFCR